MSNVAPYRSATVEVEPREQFDTIEVPLVALACGLLGFVPEALHGRVGAGGTLGLLMIGFAIYALVSQYRARIS